MDGCVCYLQAWAPLANMEVHCWWCRTPVFGLLQMSMALSGVPLSHNTVSFPFFQVVSLNSSFKNDHRIQSKFVPLELEAGVLLLLALDPKYSLRQFKWCLGNLQWKPTMASVLHLSDVKLWTSLPLLILHQNGIFLAIGWQTTTCKVHFRDT